MTYLLDWSNVEQRNRHVSLLSGLFFGIAWWLMIDATAITNVQAYTTEQGAIPFVFWIPGLVGSLALFLISALPVSVINEDSSFGFGNDARTQAQRICLFFSLFLLFGCLLGGVWIFVQVYAIVPTADKTVGVELLVHNLLIVGAALFWKFGRKMEESI